MDALEIVRQNRLEIIQFAKTFLGRPYSYRDFNCGHFIRAVYEKFGLFLTGTSFKSIVNFDDPDEVGKLIFLKRRADMRNLRHTHIAIYIGNRQVIHNTFYLGKRVVISTLEEILLIYEIIA